MKRSQALYEQKDTLVEQPRKLKGSVVKRKGVASLVIKHKNLVKEALVKEAEWLASFHFFYLRRTLLEYRGLFQLPSKDDPS